MSKKQPINNEGEQLLKGIGERLKKQKERKPKDKEPSDKKEKFEDSQEQKDEDNIKEKEIKDKYKKDDKEKNWKAQKDDYKTTYTIKPYMEKDYDQCRRKFRKELRTLLSRQDAIELGWLLLKNLDDATFEEVRQNFSPEDDS